ncbi:MAG TPA: homoserine dehydrogenase, partial [Erysipelotrichaceae bacterium]|nr:homoserine dehydrogenase [Erysipelotrichaceae bacterium]
ARDELQDFSYEVKTFEGQEYLHIQKAEVYEMHQVMERMLKTDVHAFMASIYEREDD